MISQLFILTPRGDTVVSKDYRGDCPRGTADIFFRKLQTYGSDPPPIFSIETIHFIYIRRNKLYFVCTTKFNAAPAMCLELLTRVSNLCKDYCGVLTEESIRLNFVLVYEILDEAIDFGYGQTTTTEELKTCVYNDPVAVEGVTADIKGFRRLSAEEPGKKSKTRRQAPSSAPNKPISLRLKGDKKDRKNEIFIDLLERLTVLFDANGSVVRSEINGCIQMKSFLQGLPELRVGLNEDLNIGKGPQGISYGLTIDDCNFHECVKLDRFEDERTLILRPPDGEFTLMNYRISGNPQSALPFRTVLSIEDAHGDSRVDVIIRLDCDIPAKSHGSNIAVRIPLPKDTTSCAYELGAAGQTVEYKKEERVAHWKLSKVSGGLSYYCRLKLMMPDIAKVRQEVGPISLEFEVPMYVCSGLAIRFLRVLERGRNYVPFRWVRYITHSDSYVFRV